MNIKKLSSKFIVVLATITMLIGITNTPFVEAKDNIPLNQDRKIVETVEFTNQELLDFLEEKNFDKDIIESYREIIKDSNSSSSKDSKLTSEKLSSEYVTIESEETPNFIYHYSDGSFEIGLNKETLRWGAVIGTAAFVGVLAAIPGVGWSIAGAVAGTILGYASSTIPRGYAFVFVPDGFGYELHGVYPIAGY